MSLKFRCAAWRNRVDRTLDRLPVGVITQPLEMALGLVLIINACRGLVLNDITPSLEVLPAPTQVLYMLVSLIGGVGLTTGLLMPNRPFEQPISAPIPVGTALERSFLFIVAGAYLGLGFAVVANNLHRGAGTALLCGIIGLACLLRTWAIRRTTKAVVASTLKRGRGEQ